MFMHTLLQHEAAAMSCGPGLSDRLQAAALTAMQELHPFRRSVSMVDESQYDTISAPMLVSGAGHDAMAMSHLTQVRCFHQKHSIVS
jgi:allantoate deiminase